MAVKKPYILTYRPNKRDKSNFNLYMHDDRYHSNRWQARKTIELLYKDYETLFDYVEPCDSNAKCYSLRIFELLLRTCTEVESNMKEILVNNGYRKESKYLNMCDYSKLNDTHYLSKFKVVMPNWKGKNKVVPFGVWNKSISNSLPWYSSYNKVKHNRQNSFKEANLRTTVHAFCGLLVLYAAQFYDSKFADPSFSNFYGFEGLDDGLEEAIGAPFRVKFPKYPDSQKYDFCWDELKKEENPYDKLFDSEPCQSK